MHCSMQVRQGHSLIRGRLKGYSIAHESGDISRCTATTAREPSNILPRNMAESISLKYLICIVMNLRFCVRHVCFIYRMDGFRALSHAKSALRQNTQMHTNARLRQCNPFDARVVDKDYLKECLLVWLRQGCWVLG